MQPLNVNYHFSNERCKSVYLDVVIPSLDEIIYPDAYFGDCLTDMITITQSVSYFDAEGIEQSINKKVILIVGKEEKAVKVLDNTEDYLVGQSHLESAMPLLKVKGNSFLPDQADISPYNFAQKCTGNPRQMIVYKEPNSKKKYIFPKTKTTKSFKTPADLKDGFYTFLKAYFANDNTKGEKPKVYTRKQMQ